MSANLLVWLAVDEGAGAQGICTSIGQRETDPAAKHARQQDVEIRKMEQKDLELASSPEHIRVTTSC